MSFIDSVQFSISVWIKFSIPTVAIATFRQSGITGWKCCFTASL